MLARSITSMGPVTAADEREHRQPKNGDHRRNSGPKWIENA
jgi:hypothetical protein